MAEGAKRLAAKSETLRELFLRSGNLCTYPGCNRLMLSESGKFVGQLCHIEAAGVPTGDYCNLRFMSHD